jgi:GNAT superfamily N-acetyltransferase
VTLDSPLGALAVARATLADAPLVGALRDELASWMLQRGIRQWSPGEMPLDWIEVCIAFGEVYLVSRDERLVGSVTVVWADPLIWGERTESAGYIHMLMVDRAFAGHGIGRSILEWSEGLVAASGRRLARLDCVEDNQSLRAYYEAAGYGFVGIKTFPDLDWAGDTALYEKQLPSETAVASES